MNNYLGFHSVIDSTVSAHFSSGVFLFVYSSFAAHVQSYLFHFSRLLSVDFYFKGSIKLQIIVIYILSYSDPFFRSSTIFQLLSLLNAFSLNSFHHVVLGDFNLHIDVFILFTSISYVLHNNPNTTFWFIFWIIDILKLFLQFFSS